MSILKKEYELSVWTEELDSSGKQIEKKGMIIGANDMTYEGRATGIKLKREIKGTNTLTFQMPSKFYDNEKGEFVHNEFVDYLLNETKLKLKYREEWYEFYIKKITEEKKYKAIMYSYECEDSFINELSRTGYEIEFADELNNSVAEVGDFMEEILDDSVWDYTPEHNIGDFTEFKEQRFYRIPLEQFGGKITGYPIDLEVDYTLLLDDNGQPKDYLKKILDKDGLEWNKISNKKDFVEKLLTIENIYTNEKRIIELGDDLAREHQLFWDNYYKDNGKKLLDSKKMVSLEGNYIYVPITDLSMILGTVYEDSYKAVEEPALYGYYGGVDRGYALQPISENPSGFIQFIFLKEGDEYNIDEGGILANNEYHYIIPIEEWNNLLKENLSKKDYSKKGYLYWKQPLSSALKKSEKYNIKEDSDNKIAYTYGATPSSSTIDNFNWYPVYYDGYLDTIKDLEVTQARKISVTDRTEYNKNADMFVTVYNNKANEYCTDEDLYSEVELTKKIKNGEDYRVCSKTDTRQILPTLSRNLVENGTKITSTNGWETKVQNKNNDKDTGTGSASTLLTISVKSTIQKTTSLTETKEVSIDDYDLDGNIDDESISDYYLELLSPCINKTIDFSKEGTTSTDYALNFGIISQEKKIEKDKIYAIRIKTGDIKITGATISYRNLDKIDNLATEQEANTASKEYKQMMYDYKKLFDCFSEENAQKCSEKLKTIGINLSASGQNEITLFYEIIKRYPSSGDTVRGEKIKAIDSLINSILFGGENVMIWTKNNLVVNNEEQVNFEKWNNGKLAGLISIYDKNNKIKNYQKISSIAIKPTKNDNGEYSYTYSDVKFLKFYLYWHLNSYQLSDNFVSSYQADTTEQLTNSIILSWIDEYIVYDKEFNQKINDDLDKIVIGAGAIDLNGNYSIQGIDDENKNYISFSKLFNSQPSLCFVPKKDKQFNATALKEKWYHNLTKAADNSKKWSWSNTKNGDYSIEDDAFLLFKANRTIENPYIAIKTESGPLEIIFNSIQVEKYEESVNNGVVFNVCDTLQTNKNPYYYDNIPIKLIPVTTSTCDEEFLNLIGYDKKTGDFDINCSGNLVWKDSYLISKYNNWADTTDANNPACCGVFLKNSNEDKSIPYLYFQNNIFCGIVYLDKR